MALYHCCMSAAHAQACALVGFRDDELVEVTEWPPAVDPNDSDAAYAIEMLEPPASFRLGDYPTRRDGQGRPEYLVPGRALNRFRRAVWPRPGGG